MTDESIDDMITIPGRVNDLEKSSHNHDWRLGKLEEAQAPLRLTIVEEKVGRIEKLEKRFGDLEKKVDGSRESIDSLRSYLKGAMAIISGIVVLAGVVIGALSLFIHG